MTDFVMTITDARFRLGQAVMKVGQYSAYGRVCGFAIGEDSKLCYVVEHKAQVAGAFKHIYGDSVLCLANDPYDEQGVGVDDLTPKEPPRPGGSAVTPEPSKPIDEPAPAPGIPMYAIGKPIDNSYIQSSRVQASQARGYTGDACSDCGNFTLTRNGTCLKCDTCGATSGCS